MKIGNINWYKYEFDSIIEYQNLIAQIDNDVVWESAGEVIINGKYAIDILWHDVDQPDEWKIYIVNPPSDDYFNHTNGWEWQPETT